MRRVTTEKDSMDIGEDQEHWLTPHPFVCHDIIHQYKNRVPADADFDHGRVVEVQIVDELDMLPQGAYSSTTVSPATPSKCLSRVTTGSPCCKAKAAIHRSLSGIWRPFLRRAMQVRP